MHGLKDRPPKLGEWLLKRFLLADECHEKLGDFEEGYHIKAGEKGKRRALVWYWLQLIMTIPVFVKNLFYWRLNMLRNYFKIALRNMKRHKGYSFIKVIGLAVGMACSILILIFIRHELSYDMFHENIDDIYRVITKSMSDKRLHNSVPGLLGPTLVREFPEVMMSSRLLPDDAVLKTVKMTEYGARIYLVDPEFLEIFNFPLIKGNPKTALNDPFEVVISQKISKKIFGDQNPIGKTISIIRYRSGGVNDYMVTGILKEIPDNSHFKFDLLGSFETLFSLGVRNYIENWNSLAFPAYIRLKKNCNPNVLKRKFSAFEKRHLGDNPEYSFHLDPVKDIHLHGNIPGEIEPNGNIRHIYFLSIIGFLLLLTACFNYINLSTARSSKRFKEVGIRKVVGADRRQLIWQFLGESLILTIVAAVMAFLLVKLFLPILSTHHEVDLNIDIFSSMIVLICMVLFLSIAGGSYPAFILSSFKPVNTIKNSIEGVSKFSSVLRNSLVLIQFIISIGLIICTLTIYTQLNYINNRNLGYKENNIVLINLRDENLRNHYKSFKQELNKHSSIYKTSAFWMLPNNIRNRSYPNWEGKPEDKHILVYYTRVDHDFIDLFEMNILEGRKFSKEIRTDADDAFIVNESMVKEAGWKNPIGKRLTHWSGTGTVIGVLSDFHFSSLHDKIKPLAISLINPSSNNFFIQTLGVKINSDNLKGTLNYIEKKFKEFSPGYPFEYSFLDEKIDNMYKAEKKFGKEFLYFSVIAIFIACLGLIGLASFSAERKTKEVGIRKVLGAHVSSIAVMHSKEFLKWVILANLVACPITYIIMNKWLQNFAYRIGMSVWLFVFSAFLALIFALLSVSFQSIKAATANPVDSLRYE